jgi:hypothetical protein
MPCNGIVQKEADREAVLAGGALGKAVTPKILGGLRDWFLSDHESNSRAAAEVLRDIMRDGVRIFQTPSGRWMTRTVEELAK